MIDFRALCAELTKHLSLLDDPPGELVARAQASLSEPVVGPAAPSDEDLYDLADVLNGDPVPAMRRALELWATTPTTPIPVAERLPGAGDCDGEGRCWLGMPDHGTDPSWTLTMPRNVNRYHSHWLPFHALPPPATP